MGAAELPHPPRAPTPRITIWRKLKRLGIAQLSDGLVALPADARTREHLEWIADEVLDAGGTATAWLAQPASAAQERSLAEGMADARAAEYQQVLGEAEQARTADEATRRGVLRRLRAELRRIHRRDYFRLSGVPPRPPWPPCTPTTTATIPRRVPPKEWTTCAGIHIDRAACAWLIRRAPTCWDANPPDHQDRGGRAVGRTEVRSLTPPHQRRRGRLVG
ncbi:chromate resistance protein [Streptomyces halobius]|uniref:Chromate resistance protein n=1 Tax=Streptomyces halobius TaxID=2879846 RepID=A0ABY4M2R5_9ACTN|nr:chromate resistance protein [Streptomyces halobius]UQA90691.1 chromate resistance protein [Streptomyces halobius]